MSIVIRMDGQKSPAEPFLIHKGCVVFRTYHQDGGTSPVPNLFTTYGDVDSDESSCFDVSQLPESRGFEERIGETETQRDIIRMAIDNGHLDKVGLRSFQVDVTFVLQTPDGQEQELTEMTMSVDISGQRIPDIVAELSRSLANAKPWKNYRWDSRNECQSTKVTLYPSSE